MARQAKEKQQTTTVSTTSPPRPPPHPFTKAPSILTPFLTPLSPNQVYLIHLDTSPLEFKQRSFYVPLVLNIAIAILIAYRIYTGFSIYPPMLATLLGLSTSSIVDTSTTPLTTMLLIIAKRTLNLAFDYLLLSIFSTWPLGFLLGPVKWRRAIGLRDREIIVRQSQQSWSRGLKRDAWITEDESARDRIVAAVTPERLTKSGYLLVDADWNLEYDAMIRAHGLVDQNRKGEGVPLDEFRTGVLVHTDAHGWLIWRIDEESPQGRAQKHQRDQILAFRDKLAEFGKEDLFFRWAEIIQYESSQEGGFTPERQRRAMVEAKKLFEDNGVDFSQFWREVGGMEGVSGFDQE